MKKTHKQVVGLVSLGAVVGMTIFAATLPSPGASAATSSITDTIVVRIVGDTPDVTFTSPSENIIVTSPNQELAFTYENIDTLSLVMKYIGEGGQAITTNIVDLAPDYNPGTYSTVVNFGDYGYGRFEFYLKGNGFGGVVDTDAIVITYSQMNSYLDIDEEDETVSVIFDYDDEAAPDKIVVTVFDQDGTTPVYTKTVTPPTRELLVPFDDIEGLTSGDYIIRVEGYVDGSKIYTGDFTYRYETIPVPDTGSFFKNFNISREDFLVTGLIMFFAISAIGVGVMIKKKR